MVPSEKLLTDLTVSVKENTEAYIRLDATINSKMTSLREDHTELKDIVTNMAKQLANHTERITAGETRMLEFQHLHRQLSDLRTTVAELKAKHEATAPVKTPWTATVSVIIACGAFVWTLVGR